MSVSPEVSDEESERPSGFPGARLKHTQTIMGGRSGGMGMRVHGKRASISKRFSGTTPWVDVQNFVSGNTLAQEAMSTSAPTIPSLAAKSPPMEPSSLQQSVNVHIQEATIPEDTPVQKVVQFAPKFKHTAEMEARRRVRMAARRTPADNLQHPRPQASFDSSSSEEEAPLEGESSSDEGDFDDDGPEVDSMDEGDPFDLSVLIISLVLGLSNPFQRISCGTAWRQFRQ